MKFGIIISTSVLLVQAAIVLSWDTQRLAVPGEFPYIVGIMWKPNEISSLFTSCAATVLNEFWYLTAAHCIDFTPESGRLVVKAGSHNIGTTSEHDQIIEIASVNTHGKYPGRGPVIGNLAHYDIGLIKGQTALVFNDFVKPIKLPKPKTLIGDQKLEYNFIASGWGLFPHAMMPDQPTAMRTIHLPKVRSRVCQDAIRNHIPGFIFSDHQMCTRPLDGTIGACIANHGGPLVQYNKDNKPIVIGVVSWSSLPCTTNNLPPVYVRVSHFVNWIKKKMKP
ncbi:PREDICTED: trypsin-6-like [Ceratosolen solmsi marchali]|uniref:Trypsin-6-like n=1 Tax=Ceratosolen solmsi marchali TaxID=326594 RepID=A0AAJ6YQM2_9HYME|nr:PREDICTED: trypsin-6-like [Ceratosolen solmsi marchali]